MHASQDQFAQPGLEKRHFTTLETFYARCIDIHADNTVTHIGKYGRLYEAHIPTSENTDSHNYCLSF